VKLYPPLSTPSIELLIKVPSVVSLKFAFCCLANSSWHQIFTLHYVLKLYLRWKRQCLYIL